VKKQPTISPMLHHMSRPTGHVIVNWVTTPDACVHTADTTRLDKINSKHL